MEGVLPPQEKRMNLKYTRRISKSSKNKAMSVTIPRAVAEIWEKYEKVDVMFDGNSIVIRPSRGEIL